MTARNAFTCRIRPTPHAARKVGYGLDQGIEMGPVITADSKQRIEKLIAQGEQPRARRCWWTAATGRGRGYEDGYFVLPDRPGPMCRPRATLASTEIFGPVLSLMHADTVDEAIALVNGRAYGNMACLFTSSGAAARQFRYEVHGGNVGINVGVAAPMAYFPFTGWKDSFFGDLHAQGRDAVEFYTAEEGRRRALAEGVVEEVLTM